MSTDFPIVEVILLGMVAAFLILRLRNTLGRREGHEQDDPYGANSRQQDNSNVVPMPGVDLDDDSRQNRDPLPDELDENASPLDRTLAEISARDVNFDRISFCQGARGAYEMIIIGFAQGDEKQLKTMLAKDVMASFKMAIDARNQQGHTMETTLVGIDRCDIVGAELDGRQAEVTVEIEAEIVTVTRDADGDIVSGSADEVAVVTETWTFGRDTGSRDPNWLLTATS